MKRRLLEWLGILKLQRRIEQQQIKIDLLTSLLGEETIVGADVSPHIKSPSVVIVFTRAAGGHIRFIDVEIKSMMDLKRMMEQIRLAYGVPERDAFYDLPHGWPPPREWRDH